jgi:hypothetical protein
MKRIYVVLIALLFPVATCAAGLPATLNLQVSAGEDFAYTVRLTSCSKYSPLDNSCVTSTTPVNLTGYVFKAQVKTTPYSQVVLANFSTSVIPSVGQVSWYLSNITTSGLTGKTGYWDLLMKAPDDSLSYVLKGVVIFSPRITHW